MGYFLDLQSISGIAKLKLHISDSTALQTVQKIERNYVLWKIAQLITKICLLNLAIYFIPTATALIPMANLGNTFKNIFTLCAFLKMISLSSFLGKIWAIWNKSCQGLPGANEIVKLEMRGDF